MLSVCRHLLNEQQIDSRYNCTVNLTGNAVKYDSSAPCGQWCSSMFAIFYLSVGETTLMWANRLRSCSLNHDDFGHAGETTSTCRRNDWHSEDICLQTLTSFSLTRALISGACGWQKLFRAGQILYSQTNFQRNFRQVSILGFPLNFVSEALSWYSNFPPGFRMKSSIYVKRQSFEVGEFSVISLVLIAFCQP